MHPQTRARAAVTATLRALASAPELPSHLDALIALPPVRTAWVRRVRGHNLWIVYDHRPGVVFALGVLSSPPVPIE